MIKIVVPELAESITEGTIAEWLKNTGDRVEQGEAVAVLETDKVNIEVTATSSGVIQELLKEEGDIVEVGDEIAILDSASSPETAPETGSERTESTTEQEAQKEEVVVTPPTPDVQATSQVEQITPEPGQRLINQPVASPAARKQAREQGIDLNEVQSRDPLGRIRSEDVQAHVAKDKQSQPAVTPSSTPSVSNEADASAERPVERIRMSRRRQTIAKRLVEAQHQSAMLTTFNEVDMSAILDLRRRRQEQFVEQHGVKLGFMSFFTKAVIGALKAFPRINAEIQGDDMIIKKYYDIGVAVSADEGLVVPVIRNADRLSFAEIEKQIAHLAEKTRSNQLTLDDLTGGTFTITNGGIFGSLFSTPILNTPQVGILGMHTIQNRPVAVGDEIEIRPMMYIALSYDHRIVDGSEAVRFLVTIKEMLEDPETLLLEG